MNSIQALDKGGTITIQISEQDGHAVVQATQVLEYHQMLCQRFLSHYLPPKKMEQVLDYLLAKK